MKTNIDKTKEMNTKIPSNQKSYPIDDQVKHTEKDIHTIPMDCKIHVYQISQYIDTDDVVSSSECVCTLDELLHHDDVKIRGIAHVITTTPEIQSRITKGMNALILEAYDQDEQVSHFVPMTSPNPIHIATAIGDLCQKYHAENIPLWIVHKSIDGEEE